MPKLSALGTEVMPTTQSMLLIFLQLGFSNGSHSYKETLLT